ncbi:MAG: flagellar motor switch protein FliN [Acidobacteriia bacterium]|nr:flagellar motor switch protein FliN [Terriglobia bacterium]
MPDETTTGSAAWLAEEWAKQLTRVLETMAGEAPAVTYFSDELRADEPDSEELLWWEQPLSVDDALIWIGAGRASWEDIGKRVMRSAGIDEQDPEVLQGTYLEVLGQALSGVASAVAARLGREVSCSAGRQAAPAASQGLAVYKFQVASGEHSFPLLAVYSKVLVDIDQKPVDSPARPQRTTTPSEPEEPQPPNSIDLLMDVELPVSVSFGRAQLALKDVIKLTTGSIVELNRAVSEPVEVIVNNCVIARGEVVVVEGNFGIRIKQVISRQERLRTLY